MRSRKRSTPQRIATALRNAIILASTIAVSLTAAAQDFEIISSNVSDGQAGVALRDTFYFEFSRQLPFNSLFTRGFHWEPSELAHRTDAFLDADRIRPRFTIGHEPDTDYAVYVYGVQAQNGSYLARPFTLSYTTAPSHGTLALSGALEPGVRSGLSKRENLALVARLITSAFRGRLGNGGSYGKGVSPAGAVSPGNAVSSERAVSPGDAELSKSAGSLATHRRAPRGTSGTSDIAVRGAPASGVALSATSFDRSVVFLLDEFSIDRDDWLVRAAETVDANGRFEFQHVRSGTYYPVSIEFADASGDAIAAFGFYDPDGDYAPDVVDLGTQDLHDIMLDVYEYEGGTAFAYTDLLDQLLATRSDSLALTSISTLNVSNTGFSEQWEYSYYSAQDDSVYAAEVNPISISIEAFEASPFASAYRPIAIDDALDSNEALAVAESAGGVEFRADADEEDLVITLRGGSLYDEWPTDPLRLLWRVRYEDGNPLDEAFRSYTVYIDMNSGAVVQVVDTPTEDLPEMPAAVTLRQNYPNPFNPATTISFELSSPGRASLEIYDAMGRKVEVLMSGPMPAGPHEVVWSAGDLPSGTYFCRLSAGGGVDTRSMILLR